MNNPTKIAIALANTCATVQNLDRQLGHIRSSLAPEVQVWFEEYKQKQVVLIYQESKHAFKGPREAAMNQFYAATAIVTQARDLAGQSTTTAEFWNLKRRLSEETVTITELRDAGIIVLIQA